MDKNELIKIKKRLLAFGLAGAILGTVGCTNNNDKNSAPKCASISSEYSNASNYYKYIIQDGNAVKVYNSTNVYLLFNKKTYKVNEYIYHNHVNYFGGVELYDLESEEMLVYGDGINTAYNEDYFKYLIENNYQVCFAEVSDYIEGLIDKEYYSLDEIKELEPLIAESLKIINSVKARTKQ